MSNNRGFTLIEVVVAVFIAAVGIAAAFGLTSDTLASIRFATDKMTAAYLAKEGIEIVKNIRDSNYLRTHSATEWDDYLRVDQGASIGDYSSGALAEYAGQFLMFDDSTNRFYNYSAGNPTIYTRKITVTHPGGNVGLLDVNVEVDWSVGGRNHSFAAKEILYNWW